MQTRCPHCQTTFRVSQAQLNAARGKVRCGKCQQVFNAREHIHPPDVATTDRNTPQEISTPPQIDWLQQTHKSSIEHIDLGKTTDNTADIEISDTFTANHDAEHDTVQTESLADEGSFTSSLTDEPSSTIETANNIDPPDEGLDAAGPGLEPTTASPDQAEIASKDSLIPGDLNINQQQPENINILPGLEPVYEDDTHLNALDERGLDQLQGDIQRQLQTPPDDAETSMDDTTSSRYSIALEDEDIDYLADENQTHDVTTVEDIELSALPGEDHTSVNWNADVDHDPDIPAALRSSMQALEKNKKRHPLFTTLMAAALLLLIAGLGLQLLVFRSYDIATQWPQTRPILTRACQYLPCVYSGRRDPRKIQLVNRDIRVHPSTKHALLISATLLNQAGYAQPFPRVDIKLSDLSGEVVAERIFSPHDYLKKGESRLKLLRPDIPTVITLDVLDPGNEAVNFEFRFL